MSFPTENVLVVPTKLFREIGYFQGFCSQVSTYRDKLLCPNHVLFLPRAQVESDPEYKQLIPYLIFTYTDPQGNVSVFRYVRGKGQGEGRLHHKQSVGVGGHISSVDATDSSGAKVDFYREGLRRELEEEVVIRSEYTEQCVGLINDDLTEVGRVHLGIVHRFELVRPEMESNEPDIIESGFRPVKELLADLSGFESWSAICLESLFAQ